MADTGRRPHHPPRLPHPRRLAVGQPAGGRNASPACLAPAPSTSTPATVLSGGPMLDGWHEGRLAGSGTSVGEGRRLYAQGKPTYAQFMTMVCASGPSVGH